MNCAVESANKLLQMYKKYPTNNHIENKLRASGWNGGDVNLEVLMKFLTNLNFQFSYTSQVYLPTPYIFSNGATWKEFIPYQKEKKWRFKTDTGFGSGNEKFDMNIMDFKTYVREMELHGVVIYGMV